MNCVIIKPIFNAFMEEVGGSKEETY